MDNMSTPDYYTQVWLEPIQDWHGPRLLAAVISEDDKSWLDFELGIMGSTLGDGNERFTPPIKLRRWFLDYMLGGTIDLYRTIETNDTRAAEALFPMLVKAGFLFIPIRDEHAATAEQVQHRAAYENLRYQMLTRPSTMEAAMAPAEPTPLLLSDLPVEEFSMSREILTRVPSLFHQDIIHNYYEIPSPTGFATFKMKKREAPGAEEVPSE